MAVEGQCGALLLQDLYCRQKALLLQRERSRSLDLFLPASYWDTQDAPTSDSSAGSVCDGTVAEAVRLVTDSVLTSHSLLIRSAVSSYLLTYSSDIQ